MATAPKRSKKWGTESEFTRRLRERQLESVMETSCALCNVGVRRSAKAGIAWFDKHSRTAKHRAAVAAAKNGGKK